MRLRRWTSLALLVPVGAHLVRQARAVAEVDPGLRRNRFLWAPGEVFVRPLLPLLRAVPLPDVPAPDGVVVTRTHLEGPGGDLPVLVCTPDSGTAVSRPGVLYVHSGGTVLGSAAQEEGQAAQLAADLDAVVVSPDYRLAPEHPYPAAPEDCYATWLWLHDRAEGLGVDPARTAVVGASAGGGLAALVTHLAEDRDGPRPVLQVLVYPMLDDRTTLVEDHRGRGRLVWTPRANRLGWTSYLGAEPRRESAPEGAVPARREDLSGLPPAWIGVGDLDLFHPEDLEYARRLRAAGVDVELVEVPRAPHAFQFARGEASRAFVASYTDALRRALSAGAGRAPDGVAR